MKYLIIGLGSMGKRRVRCLNALGITTVAGFDQREDRRLECKEKYRLQTFSDIDRAMKEFQPDAFIISVPPDAHHIYMKMAAEKGLHFFVEASVVDTNMDLIKKLVKAKNIVAAPSSTLIFHPAIKKIFEIIKSKELGVISNIIFHSGQYLPDWHTYEKVSDYYVSNPLTGGAREIVPFELSWLTQIFGFPVKVCGFNRKLIDIKGAEKIDDTYNFLFDYKDFLANITIDVVSRFATRRLLINGDKKQLIWDWNDKQIRIYNPENGHWQNIPYEMLQAAEGYNANIGENMYIDEIKSYIDAVNGKAKFVNSMENDHMVLKLLYTIEESDKKSTYLDFEL
jgi:predicted dehydrogenase